jgi:hypothetical protein
MNTEKLSNEAHTPALNKGAVSNWPFTFYRGQRVKILIAQYNEGNMQVAKIGDTGTLLVDYLDPDGKVRVKLDRKHYPLSISQTAMMPI